MWHTIRFEVETLRRVQFRGCQASGCFRIKQFSTLQAEVRPYVAEGIGGPTEMADVELVDGTTLLEVPMSYFQFLDNPVEE